MRTLPFELLSPSETIQLFIGRVMVKYRFH